MCLLICGIKEMLELFIQIVSTTRLFFLCYFYCQYSLQSWMSDLHIKINKGLDIDWRHVDWRHRPILSQWQAWCLGGRGSCLCLVAVLITVSWYRKSTFLQQENSAQAVFCLGFSSKWSFSLPLNLFIVCLSFPFVLSGPLSYPDWKSLPSL